MAPHLPVLFNARDASPRNDDTSISPTIIAGIVVAGVIGVAAAIWLSAHAYRKRVVARRKQRRASAFANYKGADSADEKPRANASIPMKGTFSREHLTASIVMPERVVLRPGASRDEILEHYSAEGKLPRPFAPFAMPSPPALIVDSTNLDPPLSGKLPTGRPSSASSWLTPIFPLASIRNSRRMSAMSSVSSIASNGTAQKRIRQLFDPVLPDELVVSLGETLSLVQKYDDGWCIVGRDSMLKPGEVELGAIPAWCFLKPVKGLHAERPMRVSSLGVTINIDAPPTLDHRDNVISWSNF